jgi:hypothetical protein
MDTSKQTRATNHTNYSITTENASQKDGTLHPNHHTDGHNIQPSSCSAFTTLGNNSRLILNSLKMAHEKRRNM